MCRNTNLCKVITAKKITIEIQLKKHIHFLTSKTILCFLQISREDDYADTKIDIKKNKTANTSTIISLQEPHSITLFTLFCEIWKMLISFCLYL